MEPIEQVPTQPVRQAAADEAPPLAVAARTDRGRVRPRNEDHYLIANLDRWLTPTDTSLPIDQRTPWLGRSQGRLLIVADGMGGHGDGDVASSLAVDAIAHYATQVMPWVVKLHEACDDDVLDELDLAVRNAHERIARTARRDRKLSRDMGTTLTLAYVVWPDAYVVHVGDTRCYLYRDGALNQITRDHTVAQELVDRHILSEADAKSSPYAHVLRNCLGGGGHHDVVAEVHRVPLRAGDGLLLCSDGLTGHLSDDQIAATLADEPDVDRCCQRLVDAANDAGGEDNITVAICRLVTDA